MKLLNVAVSMLPILRLVFEALDDGKLSKEEAVMIFTALIKGASEISYESFGDDL